MKLMKYFQGEQIKILNSIKFLKKTLQLYKCLKIQLNRISKTFLMVIILLYLHMEWLELENPTQCLGMFMINKMIMFLNLIFRELWPFQQMNFLTWKMRLRIQILDLRSNLAILKFTTNKLEIFWLTKSIIYY